MVLGAFAAVKEFKRMVEFFVSTDNLSAVSILHTNKLDNELKSNTRNQFRIPQSNLERYERYYLLEVAEKILNPKAPVTLHRKLQHLRTE